MKINLNLFFKVVLSKVFDMEVESSAIKGRKKMAK